MAEKISADFSLERETKRTKRYEESEETHIMGTAYIQKSALIQLGNPDKVRITIEPIE